MEPSIDEVNRRLQADKAYAAQGPQSCIETDDMRHQCHMREEMERNRYLQNQMAQMSIEIVRLRSALHFIEAWTFPQPNYSSDRGSNGERDFMRAVAKNALSGIG